MSPAAPDLPGLPPLSWTGVDGVATHDDRTGTLTLESAAGVDWTNDAGGGPQQHGATALAFAAPDGDFVLSARVRVPGERTTFDAGALALWADPCHWAKLCDEHAPHGEDMVVSVVTNDWSDDCNSRLLDAPAVHLRVARVGSAFAFHASSDGRTWDFVRTFRLRFGSAPLSVGFLAQAPTGDGCTAVFDEIAYAERTLPDLRDGR
ncbi:DUF1349 domain-containing protein [Curtobacterium citreum]|uniref:DUF1349 domain-containing protein n=1 Tax=Curtobacterium citreum TaxID=2036 RepID=UPI0025507DDE|nr:DUF1349 domain-containing protein [Curtobacterium citreum]MDK8173498.1 DUF1349 domain-containing protein [Curtobacterium citreum]